jgi:hypothetical protein
MKHLTKLLTLSSLFVFAASPAFAVETTITPTRIPSPRRDYKQEIKEIRVESRNEIKEIRNVAKATMTQSRLDIQKKHFNSIYSGLYNAFTRRLESLTNYQSRIQSRLDAKLVKLPGNQKLVDAKAKLTNVTTVLVPKFNTDLTAFKSQMDAVSTSTDPKSLIPQLKTLAKTVEQDLKNIRTDLVDALRLVVQAK